jgi:light-regulated signal transduction histidine kinase (bacteriophytochrome)
VYRNEKGNVAGVFAAARDITERKRAEEELRKYHEQLEDLVRERTGQLETANKDLEGFAYSVSHDLRVPLRAIDGFSQQVLKHYADKLDDEGKRFLNVVRDNTKKMSQLIDDILAFSRMGRLGMSMSEINMEELARSVFEELKPDVAGRELSIEIKPLPLCHGDQSMLRQVLVNLLGNAIKFTRPKDTALVEVGGHAESAENIYYVKDNGAGFDMQYADKLFGVFQRLHGVAEFKGTGIGLAIVKRIVTRHGGRVWAEGKVDEGATFYFTLPD